MPEEDENITKLKRIHTSNRCERCLKYGITLRVVLYPQGNLKVMLSNPTNLKQPMTTHRKDKGKQPLKSNTSEQQPSPNNQGKGKGKMAIEGTAADGEKMQQENLEDGGVQFEVPPIPDFAKKKTHSGTVVGTQDGS
ncbi:interphotoreceptor matrix proteoglycan 2 [Sesbania bispinosa]|nr:interphotoreceptor matrix proteoglycan 2 [Sesbania bispinosa]